jgi:hypothetical protein
MSHWAWVHGGTPGIDGKTNGVGRRLSLVALDTLIEEAAS